MDYQAMKRKVQIIHHRETQYRGSRQRSTRKFGDPLTVVRLCRGNLKK